MNLMTSFYLSFPNDLLIQVKSSQDFAINDRMHTLLDAYVPGCSLSTESLRTPDFVFEHESSDQKKLVQEPNRLLIANDWATEFPLDFYHVLYSVVRVQFLKRRFFSVHAACVEMNGGSILIVGHSGVGKTSILLELLKEKEIRFVSGNKTVVAFEDDGSIGTVAGTKTVTVGIQDLKRHGSDDLDFISYGNRTAVIMDTHWSTEPTQIRAIVLVALNDGVSEKSSPEIPSALHKLYPFFLDAVNADTIVNDGEHVYLGTAPEGVQEYLSKHLSEALVKIPVYSIKGSMGFVCDSIKTL